MPHPLRTIDATGLALLLGDEREHVLLDLNEEGVFTNGHLLFAANLPLSRLEQRIRAWVPRRDTPITLIADDEAVATQAAQRLTHGGYSDVATLLGGNQAWQAAGYQLFSGIHVPSKAFGEMVEHANHTPRLPPEQVVQDRQEHGHATRFHVDSRPLAEYGQFTLPDAVDCPGAELVLRAPAHAGSRSIVVNCAGRTRSIIGAQSLINAGVPNPVYALENGTMGWHLLGQALERGASRLLPLPRPAEIAVARERAVNLAKRLGVGWIDRNQLAKLQIDATRTTYCFDVRLPEDYARGHLPGFINAPGGQLVQSTDAYAPVRNARIVLYDTLGVQAPMTAHWLMQMGREVMVLAHGGSEDALPTSGESALELLYEPPATQSITPGEWIKLRAHEPARLIDCDDSRAYRRGHLQGASWLGRSRIATLLDQQQHHTLLVFTSEDGCLARFAAADAAALGLRAAWLKGGTRGAVKHIGISRTTDLLGPTDDAWYGPYHLESGVEDAMRAYIDWETGLLERIEHEPGVRFKVYVASTGSLT